MVFPPSHPPLTTETPDGGLLLPSPSEVEERIEKLSSEITVLRKLKRVVKRMAAVAEGDAVKVRVPAYAGVRREL